MFDKLLWPITFGLMCFLVTSKGGSSSEMVMNSLIGAAVGSIVSIVLIKLFHNPRNLLRANFTIAVVWGLILFMIGYPDLRVPNQPLSLSAVVGLVLLSSAPLLAVILAFIIRKFRRA